LRIIIRIAKDNAQILPWSLEIRILLLKRKTQGLNVTGRSMSRDKNSFEFQRLPWIPANVKRNENRYVRKVIIQSCTLIFVHVYPQVFLNHLMRRAKNINWIVRVDNIFHFTISLKKSAKEIENILIERNL